MCKMCSRRHGGIDSFDCLSNHPSLIPTELPIPVRHFLSLTGLTIGTKRVSCNTTTTACHALFICFVEFEVLTKGKIQLNRI